MSITIPESVTSIGNYAFEECEALRKITIGNGVTSINEGTFYQCYSLTSITIPESVTTIGYCAFYQCFGLKSIIIPNNVITIDDGAFYHCYDLTSVTLGSGVTSIGDYAFSSCEDLTSVMIPESVTSIGNYAFEHCKGLEKFEGKFATDDHRCLVVNDTLKAFAPSGLTEYPIPDGVKVIGNEAFYYCTDLMSITIPESVTTIGEAAFEHCTGLTSVTAYNPIPVNLVNEYEEDNAFLGVDCSKCTLYVPAESVELYKAAEGWSEFGEILPIDESSAITETQQDKADGHVTVYNLQGVPVLETDDAADLKTLQNGAYIVNGKKMIIAR